MELNLIEEGLVNIYESPQDKNERVVNAKELHELLEVSTPFHKWIERRVAKYKYLPVEDFWTVLTESSGGRPGTEYLLKIDVAKEIAMTENNDIGRDVRRYFIEIENKYREQNQMLPTSTGEMFALAAQQFLEIEQRMNNIETKQNETLSKVTNISEFLIKSPDRKKIERQIDVYARRNNLNTISAREQIYKILEDKHGINLEQRVKNKHKKMNEERVKKNLTPYQESTLKRKYNAMDCIVENGWLDEVMEIIAGLEM